MPEKKNQKPGSVKAYVLEDGSVVSDRYLNTFKMPARKFQHSDESQQVKPEESLFKHQELTGKGLVDPIHSIETLVEVFELNPYHYRAVKAKVADTVRVGWKLVPKVGVENPSENEKERVEEFFKGFNKELPWVDILDREGVDFYSTGNSALELFTNGAARDITGGAHIPIHTTRLHKSMEKLAQKRERKITWFKIAGSRDEDLNKETGEWGKDIPPDKRANEVIFFKNFTSRSDYYGIPDILPAIGAVLGDRQRQEFNLDFFENHAVPAYAVTISGADLDEPVEQRIKEFFQKDLKENRHSTLVLTAQKDPNDMSSEPIKFNFEALSVDVKEASFRLYRRDNRDEILSAHGVPPFRAGIAETTGMASNTAKEMTEIYKHSTIRPVQSMFEFAINKHILERLEINDWLFQFMEIDTTDEAHDLEILNKRFLNGSLSPNEVRQRLGDPEVDDPGMNTYYVNGNPISGAVEANKRKEDALKKSGEELLEIKGQLSEIVNKYKSQEVEQDG